MHNWERETRTPAMAVKTKKNELARMGTEPMIFATFWISALAVSHCYSSPLHLLSIFNFFPFKEGQWKSVPEQTLLWVEKVLREYFSLSRNERASIRSQFNQEQKLREKKRSSPGLTKLKISALHFGDFVGQTESRLPGMCALRHFLGVPIQPIMHDFAAFRKEIGSLIA